MTRYRLAGCAMAVGAMVLAPAVAHAEPAPPEVGSACPADQVDAMTLLPDEQTYVRCQEQFGSAFSWVAVQTPFEPNDVWLSYGPPSPCTVRVCVIRPVLRAVDGHPLDPKRCAVSPRPRSLGRASWPSRWFPRGAGRAAVGADAAEAVLRRTRRRLPYG